MIVPSERPNETTTKVLEDLQFFFPSSSFGKAVRDAIEDKKAELNPIYYEIDNADSSIIISDPNCRVCAVSKSFEEYVGHPRFELLGRNPSFMQGELTTNVQRWNFRRLIRARKAGNVSIVNYTAEGRPFRHEISLVPLLTNDGELLSFIGFQRAHEYLPK